MKKIEEMEIEELRKEMDELLSYLYITKEVSAYDNFEWNGLDYWDADRRYHKLSQEVILRDLLTNKNKPIIGELRLIPENTLFWSIALQDQIKLEHPIIVKVTSTTYDKSDYFYGTWQLILFENQIPGNTDKAHGEIGILFTNTLPYNLKDPSFFTFTYNQPEDVQY